MSSTHQIGPFTLEEFKPREWRAWRRLVEGDILQEGDTLSGTFGERPTTGNVGLQIGQREMMCDYRRPVPLPSKDELLDAWRDKDSGRWLVHDEGGGVAHSIAIRETAATWLRTLLPGYEEALVKVTHVAAPAALIRAGQELTARLAQEQPSPVPADGWRPIETAPKDGSVIIVARRMGEFGWVRGFSRWDGACGVYGWISRGFHQPSPGDLGLGSPTHWQPLPPPPQEKGGEA